MGQNLKKILKSELDRVSLSKKEILFIKEKTSKLILQLEKTIKKFKINASVFVGGSLAKRTMVRKKRQDVDIFIRFNNKNDIQKIEKIIKKLRIKYSIIHGSRDYVNIKKDKIMFEIIPVLKIKAPGDAENVTDSSYFHVNYVLSEIKKNPKLIDEIILAKSFCHAQKCYGAESYIKGFSGYGLELLLIQYKTFSNFLRSILKIKGKLILDPKKYYKKSQVMYELNGSKLESPIIFIDPTFKERNALAALSDETLKKFQEASSKFLKKPSHDFFKEKKIDKNKLKLNARKKKLEFGIISARTNKQAGDIAGTKLLKFARFFERGMLRYFSDVKIEFEYDEKKSAKIYFTGKKILEKTIHGPHITKVENLLKFKRKYKNTKIKNHTAHAKIKINYSLRKAFSIFTKMYKRTIKEMSITGIKLGS